MLRFQMIKLIKKEFQLECRCSCDCCLRYNKRPKKKNRAFVFCLLLYVLKTKILANNSKNKTLKTIFTFMS